MRLLTPVLDHDARAVDNLAGVALTVKNACHSIVSKKLPSLLLSASTPRAVVFRNSHTETGPLAKLLAILNLDQGNLMLITEGGNKLLVGILLAVLVQDTHVSLATVESLGSLAETAGEAVVHESQLQNTLEGVQNGHLALGGIGRNLNLLGDFGGVVLFYVRLQVEQHVSNCSFFSIKPSSSRLCVTAGCDALLAISCLPRHKFAKDRLV